MIRKLCECVNISNFTEDPARDGINWYTYCGNNPISYVDQNGNNPILAAIPIEGLVLAGGVVVIVAVNAIEGRNLGSDVVGFAQALWGANVKAWNTIKDLVKSSKIYIPDNKSVVGHIFDPSKKGHVADTPENRDLLNQTANDRGNYQVTDQWGNDWYAKDLPDGGQVWVEVDRNGKIIDGGINDTHVDANEKTGMKQQEAPNSKNSSSDSGT